MMASSSDDSNYTPYVVCQGDHLRKIAFRSGVDPDALWNDSKNAKLKELRGSGDVLSPGDVLYLPKARPPGVKVYAGGKNRYRADIPGMDVTIVLKDQNGPMADQPFELRGLPLRDGEKPQAGTTDSEGRAKLRVPVTARLCDLYLPTRNRILRVRVGDMDPLDERIGVIKRLVNQGIYGPGADPRSVDLAEGLRAFQIKYGLEVTGILDAATRAMLAKTG
jgi:hypothetical protein